MSEKKKEEMTLEEALAKIDELEKEQEETETKTHRRLTLEEVMAKLGELFGSDKE